MNDTLSFDLWNLGPGQRTTVVNSDALEVIQAFMEYVCLDSNQDRVVQEVMDDFYKEIMRSHAEVTEFAAR